MRILCEVFGLFDKRGAGGGGTPYNIRGAWGLGAYKGAAERRLTGGRKYAPKGNGKDEKEKNERAKGKKKERKGEKRACKRKKKERKGEKRAKGGSLTGGRKYAPKRNGKDEKEKKRACKRKKKERKGRKDDQKQAKGG